jgi:sugar/nucleoside kinase (ribokinase family)
MTLPRGAGEVGRDIDILVAGEINPDIVISDPDPVPRFGEIERVVDAVTMTVGSSSAIFACGAARLGLRVAFVGVVGDDPFGRYMLDALAARGIDTSACLVDPSEPTGATVILTSGRDRAMLTAMGSIGSFDVDMVPDALLDRTRHVHVGGFYLQARSRDRFPAFFAAARERDVTTSFDTNWDPTERWDGGVRAMLGEADVFLPNEAEATRIAGVDGAEAAATALAEAAGRDRADSGPIVVVKRGAAGAVAAAPGVETVRVDAMPVDPIDTTGAGDSFNAGFLHAWLRGEDLQSCLELAAACGAISTQAAGGVDGQPTLAEAEKALTAWRSARAGTG